MSNKRILVFHFLIIFILAGTFPIFSVNAQGCAATLDIIFAIDSTGSMGGVIATAKRQARDIMTGIEAAFPGSDIRFGVVDFRDYADRAPWPYIYRYSLGYDRVATQNAINALRASGGGDGPEAYARVMYETYTSFGYRAGNVGRFLIMMGDNRSHDMARTPGDPAYVAPNYYDPAANISTNAIATNMDSNGIILINLHSGPYGAQWQPIARTTGGDNYPINAAPADLVGVIIDALLIAYFDSDGDNFIPADCPCDPSDPPPGKRCGDENDAQACVNPVSWEGIICGACPAVGGTTIVNGEPVWVCTADSFPDTNICVINCSDTYDNEQDGIADVEDPDCPVPAGLVPCGRQRDAPETVWRETDRCTLCHLFLMSKRIVDFLTLYVVIPVGVLMFVVGGGMLLTATGDPGRIGGGKKILTAAIIGIIIFFLAWIIVNTVIFFLTTGRLPLPGEIGQVFGTPWNQINCPTPGAPLCP